MKIIDLLNKIVNGEEVPKKIKYEKHIYEYEEGTYDWSYYTENNGTIIFLITDVFNSDDNLLSILNDTVEILEEEKKIPEKIKDKYCSQISKAELAQKYNEIIDYLKSKGDE